MRMMALNAYVNDGSERLWKLVALNAYVDGGFGRLWK